MSRHFQTESVLIRDADIADMLGMSRAWVRKERFNRRRGLPHTLTIDPVMIGSAPRYRRSEVMDWAASLENEPSSSAVTGPLFDAWSRPLTDRDMNFQKEQKR